MAPRDEFMASVRASLQELEPELRALLPFPVHWFDLKEARSPNKPHVVTVTIDVLVERFAAQGWMNSLELSLVEYSRTPIVLWKQQVRRELTAKMKELVAAIQEPQSA